MGVAALCSDAGKVNEELTLGVSGSTSLDDVGPYWFLISLDELGPCGATTGCVVTEFGVVWIYPRWFELELQLCEALNSSEFMLGPCRDEACVNIRTWSSRSLLGTTLIYFPVIVLETVWGILVESLIVLVSAGTISLTVLEIRIRVRHTIVVVLSIVVIGIITRLVLILI